MPLRACLKIGGVCVLATEKSAPYGPSFEETVVPLSEQTDVRFWQVPPVRRNHMLIGEVVEGISVK